MIESFKESMPTTLEDNRESQIDEELAETGTSAPEVESVS